MACEEPQITAEQLIPDYRGVKTQLLDRGLVQFQVEMTNALEPANVEAYADRIFKF